MPPKSASATWPSDQNVRAAAVHNSNPTHLEPPSATASTSTAATPLQSATVPTSSQSSHEATSIHASNTNTTSQAIQSLTSPDTSSPNLGFVNRNGSESEVGLYCPTGETPQLTGGVAGTGTRKRTIVRKTVRVVKKLIKKRVPKRVLINRLGNQGEVVKAEDGVNLSEVSTNGNLDNDVIEKSNLVDEVIEETGRFSETNDTTNVANDLIEILKLQNDEDRVKETSIVRDVVEKANIRVEALNNPEIVHAPNLSRPVIGEEVDDLNAQMQSEMSKPCTYADFSEQSVPINYQSGLITTYEDDVKGNGAVSQVERDLMKPFCDAEKKDLIEVEKVNFNPGTTTETNERESTKTGNQLEGCLMENHRIDIARKSDSELLAGQDTGPVGEEIAFLGGREDVGSIGQAESCSGEVESNCIKSSDGLLLSGEMEALERKKKRKTEIFIGGLDKYTKEEDVREVFKDAGLVEEVRLVMMNPKLGKNRGYGFVRFATAADAKNALAKYSKVEVCGKQCNTAPVEGNDTIFLGNIDRNWKSEDVVKLLEKAGIEKIDEVTLKADPSNIERNRGFAFVEFQTSKDAQTAFKKLQKKDVFGKTQVVKVAWAQPLSEPAEEDILLVKSVYAEYLPSSWDEEKVKEYFKRFGEIESVALAKDLSSSRRQDFAFINYTNRDAALTCIEVVNRERLEDDCSKVKMAVSLAKPIPKRKQTEYASNLVSRQHLEEKANAFQTSKQLQGPKKRGKAASSNYDQVKVDNRSSTTAELVQLLRQQASTMHNPPHPGSGTVMPDRRFLLSGSKRPFSQAEHDPLYVDCLGLSRVRLQSSYQISGPSSLSHGVDLFSPYHHQRGLGLPSESINGRIIYPSHFQTRDRASFYEDPNPYHRH